MNMYKQVYYFQFIEIIKKNNNFDQSKSRKNPEYYIAIKYEIFIVVEFQVNFLMVELTWFKRYILHLNQLNTVIYG